MVLNEEEDLNFLDDYFKIKKFLFIFPLKWPAIFFLWLYTIFFGFLAKHTALDLFEAGFNFLFVTSHIRIIKCILSFVSFVLCFSSLSCQRAIRGAFGCIYFFSVLCLYRLLVKSVTMGEQSINLYNVYLEAMYDFFESIEDNSMKYFCYTVFTLTLALGWHISKVIFSYHRETWIPINPALEGNVADLHIESAAPKPPTKPPTTSASNQKKKKANRGRGRRR